jgi:hypothetical protein
MPSAGAAALNAGQLPSCCRSGTRTGHPEREELVRRTVARLRGRVPVPCRPGRSLVGADGSAGTGVGRVNRGGARLVTPAGHPWWSCTPRRRRSLSVTSPRSSSDRCCRSSGVTRSSRCCSPTGSPGSKGTSRSIGRCRRRGPGRRVGTDRCRSPRALPPGDGQRGCLHGPPSCPHRRPQRGHEPAAPWRSNACWNWDGWK